MAILIPHALLINKIAGRERKEILFKIQKPAMPHPQECPTTILSLLRLVVHVHLGRVAARAHVKGLSSRGEHENQKKGVCRTCLLSTNIGI